MSFARALRCRECGQEYPLEPRTVCDDDFAPVEVVYDYEAGRRHVTREAIERGPRSLWRYRDLLPVAGPARTGHHSGLTPLIRADRLAAELGVRELYIKDDSTSRPSFSYKDRVVSVAISKALEFGFEAVGCASTGNLAHAVATHAAAAGIPAYVLVPADLERGKILGTQVFGPTLIKVDGNYDQVNRLCAEVAEDLGWAIVNVNLRPYYTEGAKTFGFEIAEQLGWRLPAHTVVPVAGGTILPKIAKAYRELAIYGLVEGGGAIHAAQPAGCSPVATAIQNGASTYQPQKPNTIAKSLAIGCPADGDVVIDEVVRSGGSAASVSDEQILQAIELLARTEGVFTEPAGGTTLAAAISLIERGTIPADESICVCITGNGLKTLDAFEGRLPDAPVIAPRRGALHELLDSLADGSGALEPHSSLSVTAPISAGATRAAYLASTPRV